MWKVGSEEQLLPPLPRDPEDLEDPLDPEDPGESSETSIFDDPYSVFGTFARKMGSKFSTFKKVVILG